MILADYLREKGVEVTVLGSKNGQDLIQFSDVAEEVALAVAGDEKEETGGILMCGNGVGMSIASNKVPGIRAALCNELFTAKYAKRDTHINILCMGARVIAPRLMEEITDVWRLQAYEGGRFDERLAKFKLMEAKYLREDLA